MKITNRTAVTWDQDGSEGRERCRYLPKMERVTENKTFAPIGKRGIREKTPTETLFRQRQNHGRKK